MLGAEGVQEVSGFRAYRQVRLGLAATAWQGCVSSRLSGFQGPAVESEV